VPGSLKNQEKKKKVQPSSTELSTEVSHPPTSRRHLGNLGGRKGELLKRMFNVLNQLKREGKAKKGLARAALRRNVYPAISSGRPEGKKRDPPERRTSTYLRKGEINSPVNLQGGVGDSNWNRKHSIQSITRTSPTGELEKSRVWRIKAEPWEKNYGLQPIKKRSAGGKKFKRLFKGGSGA